MRIAICVFMLGICAGTTYVALDTETRAQRWKQNAQDADAVLESNLQIAQAYDYTTQLMRLVDNLVTENSLLCEREAKILEVVAEFEEGNRRLKSSLTEAVTRLEEQSKELNELIDENNALYYKIKVLEQALGLTPPVVENIDIIVPNPYYP